MKRRLAILLILLIIPMAFVFCTGCTSKPLSVEREENKIIQMEIKSKQPIYNEEAKKYELIEDYIGYIETRKRDYDGEPFDNVPIYDHNEILHDTHDLDYFLGRDSGLLANFSSSANYAKFIFTAFPTDAIRENSEGGNIYALYDTENGIRLYMFYSKEKNNYRTLDGFPVIMQKKLEYNDFEDIEIGNRASLVEETDSVMIEYIRFFDIMSDETLNGFTKVGAGATSIHLLTDGILKIEYKRIALGDYEITSIEYNEDFVLSGLNGDTCYKIAECDYVNEEG